uniref:Uncharacterized protein n=1 Tax=Arundo donax TaxID=35708 RepID=A0A0A9EWC8_ARUDO
MSKSKCGMLCSCCPWQGSTNLCSCASPSPPYPAKGSMTLLSEAQCSASPASSALFTSGAQFQLLLLLELSP